MVKLCHISFCFQFSGHFHNLLTNSKTKRNSERIDSLIGIRARVSRTQSTELWWARGLYFNAFVFFSALVNDSLVTVFHSHLRHIEQAVSNFVVGFHFGTSKSRIFTKKWILGFWWNIMKLSSSISDNLSRSKLPKIASTHNLSVLNLYPGNYCSNSVEHI